jgi:hypothetical protein
MKSSTAVSLVLLLILLVVGGGIVLGQQKSLSDAVTAYQELNNKGAPGAPQQTVVGTWSTREAVQSLGVIVTELGVFLAACICLSAGLLIWRLDARSTAPQAGAASDLAGASPVKRQSPMVRRQADAEREVALTPDQTADRFFDE